MRLSLRLLLFATLYPLAARAEELTVLDAATLQPVPGAKVTVAGDRVTVTAPGYEPTTEDVPPDGVIVLFRPGAEVITVESTAPRPSATGSTLITRDVIRALPGGGEDALAAVRSMPGVGQAPPTAGGRLVIRGSAPEDSRLTLDGISVPFLYHAFNNTTIVPPAGVAGIEYTPGGFGVEEGRATGGVVALTTDDELPARPHGSASVSLLEVAASAATPLGKDLAIAAALRRSTVDLIAPYAVPKNVEVGFTTAPRFYDGQVRLDWRASAHDKVSILALLSSDALGVVNKDPDSELPSAFSTETQFARLIASWKHEQGRIANRLVGALGADSWHAEIGIDQNVDGTSRQLQLRDDLRIAASQHLAVRAGGAIELANVDVQAFAILPPTEGLPPGRVDQIPIKMIDARYSPSYGAAYAAADVMPTKATTLTAGARIESFAHSRATRISPRAQARHRSGPFTLTAALGRYARDLDSAEGIPRHLRPERATHATIAGALDVDDGVSVSLAGFYTHRSDLVVEDPTVTSPTELPYKTGGTGRSTGFEVLLRAQRDRFFGWLAYTFSRSTRYDSPGAEGRPFAYDQTHLVSAVASYERGPWRYGARWQLASGLPYTAVIGSTWSETLQHHVPAFGPALGERHDLAHQLDVRVERVWRREHYRIAVFADIGNVYRHPRVLRYSYSDDFMTKKPVADMMPLPSVGVRGEF